jgi:hypothetical protein
VLGIDARTKRKVEDALYQEKMRVLAWILAEAQRRHIRVLLYVPPYRTDIDGPYIAADYARLKVDMAGMAERFGARYADLDNMVPGSEWATIVHPIYGFESEDFMHFTATGHARYAAGIDAALKEMGF